MLYICCSYVVHMCAPSYINRVSLYRVISIPVDNN